MRLWRPGGAPEMLDVASLTGQDIKTQDADSSTGRSVITVMVYYR